MTKHYTVVERVWIRSDTSMPALKIEGARHVVIRDSLIEHPPNGIGIWFKYAHACRDPTWHTLDCAAQQISR